MHEVGIATSILDAGHKEAARRAGAKLMAIGVRIGVLSGVDIDALRFAFECIVSATDDEKVVLTAENCPRVNRCELCAREYASPLLSPFTEAPCPHCGSTHTSFVSGDQLDIAFVEVEEP
ncbi:MAG: hydrogenase maturation nickel metallochaperone HypA [Acidobacteriaceae bacterium]